MDGPRMTRSDGSRLFPTGLRKEANDADIVMSRILDEQRNLWDETFSLIMNDSRFDNMPLILETPDEELWEEEIRKLYSLIIA